MITLFFYVFIHSQINYVSRSLFVRKTANLLVTLYKHVEQKGREGGRKGMRERDREGKGEGKRGGRDKLDGGREERREEWGKGKGGGGREGKRERGREGEIDQVSAQQVPLHFTSYIHHCNPLLR